MQGKIEEVRGPGVGAEAFAKGLENYGAGGRTEAQKALTIRFPQLTDSTAG
jgi:hypothetical protein